MLGVADGELALRGEDGAVARVAGRHHAVEEVESHRDEADQLLGRPDAHQVARPVLGQQRDGVARDAASQAALLADREPADGIAVEAERHEVVDAALALAGVHAALHDGEHQLVVPACARRFARRAQRVVRSIACATASGLASAGHALVEHHRDVDAEGLLERDHVLRPEEATAAVEVGLELHPILVDPAQAVQAEDLEPAAVGEDGAAANPPKACRPPCRAITSAPGRSDRW